LRTFEPVAISSIFARRIEDGIYTYSASLYQNILRYFLVLRQKRSENNSLSFTWWEITDWQTINKEDHTDKPVKDRIENPQKTIKNKLKNLVQLHLLNEAESKPMTRGSGNTPTYQFTEYGCLLAWIIESFESTTSQEVVCNAVYDLLRSIFTVDDKLAATSTSIFISQFLKKCKERGVFENIVILFRETLVRVDHSIVGMVDLFRHVFWLDFKDIEQRTFFNSLFDETINELDLETRKLVLYNLKLDIERKMRISVTDFKEFEKVRFRVKGYADTVALESHCIICDFHAVVAVDLLDYRERTANSDLGIITRECPGCGMENSLYLAIVL
jgi:hypothetical protein